MCCLFASSTVLLLHDLFLVFVKYYSTTLPNMWRMNHRLMAVFNLSWNTVKCPDLCTECISSFRVHFSIEKDHTFANFSILNPTFSILAQINMHRTDLTSFDLSYWDLLSLDFLNLYFAEATFAIRSHKDKLPHWKCSLKHNTWQDELTARQELFLCHVEFGTLILVMVPSTCINRKQV